MIILTLDQVEDVVGASSPRASLDPRPLKDGTFALPERVLVDPNHFAKWPMLCALPKRNVGTDEWVLGVP